MNSLISKIYLYKFLDGFLPIMPLYLIMFSEHSLDPLKISILLIVSSFVYILCEIPTGVLADKYSRKNLLIIGSALRAVTFIIWFLQPTFVGFLIGLIIWGVSSSLISGTYQALIHDELAVNKKASLYVKIAGRVRALSLISNFISAAAATVFLFVGDWLILAVSILMSLSASVVAATLPNPPKKEDAELVINKKILTNAFKEIRGNRLIILYLSSALVIGGTFTLIDEYGPLLFLDAGINKLYVPIVSAVFLVLAVIGSFCAVYFEKMSFRKTLIILFLVGLLITSVILLNNIAVVFVLAVSVFILKLISVLIEGRVQHEIKGKSRATILSIGELSTELFIIVLYAVYGFIAQAGSNTSAVSALGIVVIVSAILILITTSWRQSNKTLV